VLAGSRGNGAHDLAIVRAPDLEPRARDRLPPLPVDPELPVQTAPLRSLRSGPNHAAGNTPTASLREAAELGFIKDVSLEVFDPISGGTLLGSEEKALDR